jgi:hypothetical protein
MQIVRGFLVLALACYANAAFTEDVPIDAAVIEKQQAALFKDCQSKLNPTSRLDCSCLVAKYPEERLRILRDEIASREHTVELNCSRKSDLCEPQQRLLAWMKTRDVQVNFPTREGAPEQGRTRVNTHFTPNGLFAAMYVRLGSSCMR